MLAFGIVVLYSSALVVLGSRGLDFMLVLVFYLEMFYLFFL